MEDFKLIKAYYHNPYMGWSTHKPDGLCDTAYFVKVDGYYFMLGNPGTNNYHVDEVDE